MHRFAQLVSVAIQERLGQRAEAPGTPKALPLPAMAPAPGALRDEVTLLSSLSSPPLPSPVKLEEGPSAGVVPWCELPRGNSAPVAG